VHGDVCIPFLSFYFLGFEYTIIQVIAGYHGLDGHYLVQPKQCQYCFLLERGMIILMYHQQVAFEASPITTLLELEVGREMCEMLGYSLDPDKIIQPWGHIACDGSKSKLAYSFDIYSIYNTSRCQPGSE
jgi:hypothetical protein